MQTLQFTNNNSVTARTHDGLALTLGVTLQYELQAENIAKLWLLLNTNYETLLANIASDLIRDVASSWPAVQFFNNRTEIEADLRITLYDGFVSFFATLRDVQLKSSPHPTHLLSPNIPPPPSPHHLSASSPLPERGTHAPWTLPASLRLCNQFYEHNPHLQPLTLLFYLEGIDYL